MATSEESGGDGVEGVETSLGGSQLQSPLLLLLLLQLEDMAEPSFQGSPLASAKGEGSQSLSYCRWPTQAINGKQNLLKGVPTP